MTIARSPALDRRLLVLPDHQAPSTGPQGQLAADRQSKLAGFRAEPRTACESFATLFRKPIGEDDPGIATGEAVAHFHWLEAFGRVRQVASGDGAERFVVT